MLHNCQKHEEYIKSHILVFDKNGKLKCRERADLEYKESFSYSNAAKYAKTMAALQIMQVDILFLELKISQGRL